jgi:hypothetical protein
MTFLTAQRKILTVTTSEQRTINAYKLHYKEVKE